MITDNNLQIKFLDDVVIIRTVDKIGFPVDIWRFEKKNLSKNEQIFISNILSMSKCMASTQDKDKEISNREIRDIAEGIVTKTNESSNNYDAVDDVANLLKEMFNKMDIAVETLKKNSDCKCKNCGCDK